MTALLIVIWILLVICLIMVSAIRLERTRHSWFELQRRADTYAIRRDKHLIELKGIRRVIVGLTLIAVTMVAFVLWQWWGVVAAIGIWMLDGWIIRQKIVQKPANKFYKKHEEQLLRLLEKAPLIGYIVRSHLWYPYDQRIESPEHLLHMVENADAILSEEQQRIIRHGLDWHQTPIASIMVTKKDIISIKYNELLGPLVLDDLHRSGHNRFPVTKSDNIIGILDIKELLEIDSGKHSQTAERAMSQQVLHIESDEPLPAALSLLQKSRQHMLVVIDNEGKTVGIVTLADITNSLLG